MVKNFRIIVKPIRFIFEKNFKSGINEINAA